MRLIYAAFARTDKQSDKTRINFGQTYEPDGGLRILRYPSHTVIKFHLKSVSKGPATACTAQGCNLVFGELMLRTLLCTFRHQDQLLCNFVQKVRGGPTYHPIHRLEKLLDPFLEGWQTGRVTDF